MKVLSATCDVVIAVLRQLEGTGCRKLVDSEVDAVDGFESIGAAGGDWIVRNLPYLIIGRNIISEAEQCQVQGIPAGCVCDFQGVEDIDQA